ncbi:hypothetical protein KP79_PYT25132 [Mizuhopecten yessoensis]|uniref:RNA-directed DNA polymerase from mobile element jockey n=1 Tax=Mizuhopecten yessoensis TaxID=6573 RepID=A0A210PUU7_MIZYE|nr:hypothetical protein KP79_PYT25132 [Mizuhopecten yessoensis]
MPSCVTSTLRLFANDCLLYRVITSSSDAAEIQNNLDRLKKWEDDWLMSFNPNKLKCEINSITNKRNPLKLTYTIHGKALQNVSSAKYLGVNIQHNILWNKHIDTICKKANSTNAFIQRNLKKSSTGVKETCFTALVRPIVEYGSDAGLLVMHWVSLTGTIELLPCSRSSNGAPSGSEGFRPSKSCCLRSFTASLTSAQNPTSESPQHQGP